MKKGQSALEFITTYGWALVVILLAGGALWFTFGGEKFFVTESCMFGPGFYCSDFVVDEGSVQLKLKNAQGRNLDSFSFDVLQCTTTSSTESLKNGESKIFGVSGCTLNEGDVFEGLLNLAYSFSGSSIHHSKVASILAVVSGGCSQCFGGSGGGYVSDGNTMLLYNFDEGDGSIVGDLSSNGNDGTHYGNTVALYHFDGEIKDESVYDRTLPCTTSCPNFISGISGQGASMDDNKCINGSWNQVVDGEITFETWFNATDPNNNAGATVNFPRLIEYSDASGGSTNSVAQAFDKSDNNGKLRGWAHCEGGGRMATTYSGPNINDSKWHHAVYTYNGSVGNWYIDGSLRQSVSGICSTNIDDAQTLGIGCTPKGNNEYFGELDEVGIYTKVLTAQEVLDRNNGKRAKFVDWKPGVYETAMEFDGEDDYVNTSIDNFPMTELTVEFWMKSSDNTKDGTVFSYSSYPWQYNEFLIYNHRNFKIYVNGQNTSNTGVSANNGEWHHIAVTWRSSDGFLILYKDGVPSYNTTVSVGTPISSSGIVILGQEQDCIGGCFATNQAFKGMIDEVRISDYARY